MFSDARISRLTLGVFLLGTLLVAMTRGDLAVILGQVMANNPEPETACLSCHRNTAWLFQLVWGALALLSRLFFLGPETGFWPVPTYWSYADAAGNNHLTILILTYYGHRVLLALPVYWAACQLFPNPRIRLVYVLVMLALLGGWPATLINVLFHLGQLVVDWPPSYYLFPHLILNFDWASIGFVHLLAVALMRGHQRWLWAAPAYAMFGQAMMDNLGFVAGVTFFLALWQQGQRLRAVSTLIVSALGAALILGLYAVFGALTMEQAGQHAAEGETGLAAAQAWLGFYWETMGKYNFLWLNVTIANFLSVAFWPLVMGTALGLLSTRAVASTVGAYVKCLAWPTLAFFLTLILAMFKSGLGSDMGRQALPVASLLLPLSWAIAAGWRRGT